MVIMDDKGPSINWKMVDGKARKIFEILHEDKNITFLEVDMVLNLVSTECNNNKYVYLLDKSMKRLTDKDSDIASILSKPPDVGMYG